MAVEVVGQGQEELAGGPELSLVRAALAAAGARPFLAQRLPILIAYEI